ncbi:MAG: RHS repeat-associated core domain-containing protein [Rhizomicrobium sp.]
MYSPTLGRFLQPDPTGTSGSGTNLYAYVGNDPINRTDPSGNDEVDAEAAFVTQTVFQACGTNYDCQMRLSAPGTAMAAGSVAPLALAVAPEMLEAATAFGGGKALLGFGLGYGGAYLGGTKSEGGRLLAGGVGAFAVPGTASLITTTADLGYAGWGTFGIGAVGAFGGTFLGDLGAQGGDYINGVSQKISISNAVEAGAIGAIAYTGFGEGALAAKALEIPGFAGFAVDTVSGADSLLAGFGLDKLLGGASGGSNGTVKPGK